MVDNNYMDRAINVKLYIKLLFINEWSYKSITKSLLINLHLKIWHVLWGVVQFATVNQKLTTNEQNSYRISCPSACPKKLNQSQNKGDLAVFQEKIIPNRFYL